jgi:hypothetical protein
MYMKSGLQLNGNRVLKLANSCHEKIRASASKNEALEIIADFASPLIEEYYRYALEHPDEISLNFVELLDQIVFELSENMPAESMVREYLTEDLCARLNIYLDIFQGQEIYAGNLNRRILTHEDTIIIRQCGLKEYVPLLIREYYEQPVLQRSILCALLAFSSDELLNFYYSVATESGSMEVKALSLVGLKKFGTQFGHWNKLTSENEGYRQMIAYAKSFDCSAIENNEIPPNLYSLLFALQYIEATTDLFYDFSSLSWIIRMLDSMVGVGFYNTYLTDFYMSICKIVTFAGIDALKQMLGSEDLAKALVQVIDFLPREYFDRVTVKLSLLGDGFINRVNGLLSTGAMKLNDRESNTNGYVMWKMGNNL